MIGKWTPVDERFPEEPWRGMVYAYVDKKKRAISVWEAELSYGTFVATRYLQAKPPIKFTVTHWIDYPGAPNLKTNRLTRRLWDVIISLVSRSETVEKGSK